jgi:hypothetical protein
MPNTWKSEAGRRPSKILLAEASTLARPNTKTHTVVAMALRPNGVTQHEVVSLYGKPYRNVIKKLIADHKVKKYVLPEEGRSERIRLVKQH